MEVLKHFILAFFYRSDSTKSKNLWQVAIKNNRKETVMMTLRQFSAAPSTIHTITSWYLADLSKAQGKQEGKPLLKYNKGVKSPNSSFLKE